MKSKFAIVCTILLLLGFNLVTSALPVAQAGSWSYGSYSNSWGQRYYQVYVPTSYRAGTPMPLVVMLHGCLQSPDSFAAGTRMNALAEANGFMILYPQQGYINNSTYCWNWFYSINQIRDAGEPSIIAGMVNDVKSSYSVNNSKVYVGGLSAGAAMSSIMASCYPDVFAAAAVHAGYMYGAATTLAGASYAGYWGSPYSPDSTGRSAWECGGSKRLQVPTLVFQGSTDNVVYKGNADQVIGQFAQTNDYADDGVDNNSVKSVVTSTTNGTVSGGYTYQVSNFNYGGRLLMQKYLVNNMGHAWSGGDGAYSYNDPKGPNASQITWDFFKNYTR